MRVLLASSLSQVKQFMMTVEGFRPVVGVTVTVIVVTVIIAMLFVAVTIFDRLREANGSDLVQNWKRTAGQHCVASGRFVVA